MFTNSTHLNAFVLAVVVLSNIAAAQGSYASSPQAVSVVERSMLALTGGNPVKDVTLAGSVIWNGSDTGSASLKARAQGASRIDLVLPSGMRTEIRDASTGVPLGWWITPKNVSGEVSSHNCLTDPVWFFPALSFLAGSANVAFSYVGQEDRNGVMVDHLQSTIVPPEQLSDASQSDLSKVDYYLDSGTFLPVAFTFNVHPDDDQNTNLRVEVDFSNYQTIAGVAVPMHIQRRQQGALIVDIVLTTATFNTNLPLSTFSIN